MKLSVRLATLLIVLIPLYAIGDPPSSREQKVEVNKSKLEELISAYEGAVAILRKHVILLEQEKTRWLDIHNHPERDKVTCTPAGKAGEFVLDIEIGSSINNKINSQPIKRKIPVTVKNWGNFTDGVELNILASAGIGYGIKPGVSVSYFPLCIKSLLGQEVGVGAYTNIYSTGVDVAYKHAKLRNLSLHLLIGYGLDGKVCPGVSVGARF